MSYIKKLWFEEGLYPTEDFDFGELYFENDYDFFDIDDDAPVTGDDDGKFNFGSLDDNEPHAIGDYDMNNESEEYDYDFGDVDDGSIEIDYDMNDPEHEFDFEFHDQDIDPAPVEEDNMMFNFLDLDWTDPDYQPEIIDDDDGKFNFADTEDEPEAEGDWDFDKDIPVNPDPENDIDFYDIDEDDPVVGPDDEVFNMGDLNPNDVPLPDYNFYDTDEDPIPTYDDDGLWNFGNIEEDFPHATGDYNYGDYDDGETDAHGDYNFYDIDEDPPVTGDDDGQFNFLNPDDTVSDGYDYDFEDIDDPILINENNDIVSICTVLYMESIFSDSIEIEKYYGPDDGQFNFYDIDEDPAVTGDDDYLYNFGSIDDDEYEPCAEGNYDFLDEDDSYSILVDETDSNFYDIDEDPAVVGQDDGQFNFVDNSGDDPNTSTGDYCYDLDEDYNTTRRDHDFYDIDEDDPVTGEDDGKYDFHNIEKYEPYAELKYNFFDEDEIHTDIVDESDFEFGELEDRDILVNDINDIISISIALYEESEYNMSIMIAEPPVILDDDDLIYNFGNITDDEPHATGDYDMEVGSVDYNFYDIDEDLVIEYDMNANGFVDMPIGDSIPILLAKYLYDEEEYIQDLGFITISDTTPVDYNFYDEDIEPVVDEQDDYKYNFDDEDHTDTDNPPIINDDDGSFNFIDNTFDDPCTAVGEYNFFELDEIESDLVGEEDFDFGDEDINPVVDEEDDGLFNFVYIEDDYDVEDFNEWDWDFNVDDIPIDMHAIPEEEGTDWDFGDIIEEEGWDFYDIDIPEYADMRHTQYDIDYDFGDEGKIGWILTRDTIRKYIEDACQELLHRTDLGIAETEFRYQQIYPYITYQYFYNERTNKSFIEFDICNDNNLFDSNKLKRLIKTKIVNQFRLDTDIWPELVNDDVYDRSGDTAYSVTPYTIGYWQSVNGHYEAIEDKAEVEMDLFDKQLPPMRAANIWTLYQVAEEISRRYNLIKDTIDITNKTIYIQRSMEIMAEYRLDKDLYNEKMRELNEEYLTNNYDNSNIPEAVTEYMNWYREYFNANMPQVHMFTRRHYLQMSNI